MKILFIAPLPPPVTGHSLASEIFLDHLAKKHEVDVVNLSKDSLENGVSSVARIGQIFGVFKSVLAKEKSADAIYFTISESIAGNVKDIIIYLICSGSLHKMAIHLHGGSIKKLIFDRHRLLFRINRYFIRRLGCVIVLGSSHIETFTDIIPRDKIHIVPNCAADELCIEATRLLEKYDHVPPLRILFLSNLIRGKGHEELLEAFMALDDTLKDQVNINFAGSFESEEQEKEFLELTHGHRQVRYHGIVQGTEKKNLLFRSHVLCLPTSLFEGQPMCILEAYASGCVVVTTNQGGIRDIFQDGINGFEVQQKSAASIKRAIEKILGNPNQLLSLAETNRQVADAKYRASIYNESLGNIIETIR